MQLTNSTSIENTTGFSVHSFNLSNSPHIFKVLYSSMYERKEEAVIRELACNARDALHQAGKFDVPVEITLPTEDAPELVVSDSGIGMSYEEVTAIYPNYGASTKRGNNTDIGGFGYGSKSPFALSPSFTVKTTKDGITTTLSCFLDEGTPKFIPFTSGNVGNADGTTISVPISDTGAARRFILPINSLFLLWEVKPAVHNLPTGVALYPPATVQDNKTWYHFSSGLYAGDRELYVAVGPLVYRIPSVTAREILASADYQLFKKLLNGGVAVPKFDIGALELAPSREFIEDTPENNKAIKKYFQDVVTSISTRLLDTPENIVRNLYELFYKTSKIYKDVIVWVDSAKIKAYLASVTTDYDALIAGYIQGQFISNPTFIEKMEKEGTSLDICPTGVAGYDCVSYVGRSRNPLYVLNLQGCLQTNWDLKHTTYVFARPSVKLSAYSTTKNGSLRSSTLWLHHNGPLSRTPKLVFSPVTAELKAYVNAVNGDINDFIGVNASNEAELIKYLDDNKSTLVPFVVVGQTEIDKAWSTRPKPVRTQSKTTKAGAPTDVLGVTHKGVDVTLTELSDETFSSKKLVVVTELKHKKEAGYISSVLYGMLKDDVVVLFLAKTATKKVKSAISSFTSRNNVHEMDSFTVEKVTKLVAEHPAVVQLATLAVRLERLKYSTVFTEDFALLGIPLITPEEDEIRLRGVSTYVARRVVDTPVDKTRLPVLSPRLTALLYGARSLRKEGSGAIDVFTSTELRELQKHVTALRNTILKQRVKLP